MSYSREDYEADLADEYRADEAWDALMEESMLTCEHEMWEVTDEGIADVVHWRGNKKLDEAIAFVEIKCCFCGKTNYGKVPNAKIVEMLAKEFEHTGAFDIDEDNWG